MHEPWLTPAFGDHPSGNDRHKADPPAVRGDAQIPTRLEQDAPPHQPGADQRCRDHEEAGRQHDPEREENGHYRWALLRWHFLQPEELAVETMGQDQRRALRDRDREAVFFSLLVRPCKHMEVAAAKRVPMRLHGGDLDGLMLEGIEPVQVTEQNLQWCEKSEQPDRHSHHGSCLIGMSIGQQVARADRQHHESGRQIGRIQHVGEAIRKARVEDDSPPGERNCDPVDDLMSFRSLHPAVGSKDPETGDHRANRDHHCREHLQSNGNAPRAEQQDA